ncbi:MAG: peptidase M14 family protein [Acidobacteria bacterium]|nr:peptidase M14 family protein [Acidobacteriota bacterium]
MRRTFLLVTMLISLGIGGLAVDSLPTPAEFFGFEPGADCRLVRWDKMVEYLYLLDRASDRLEVREIGKSTQGNPFLLALVSDAETLRHQDRYRGINRRLADPRGLTDEEIDRMVAAGKYTLAVTCSLHATEVAPTQSVPALVHWLITDEDELAQLIRRECILVLFPCFNPDGQLIVTDWYTKTHGTEYEGARLPYLYHPYTGHDNNRDGYMMTQAEARLVSKVLYQEWFPQAFIDHHQMGSYGARFYIPPYYDPVQTDVDPLIWREHLLYGAQMAVRLEQAGVTGVETGAPFTGWWRPSFHMITNYHNISGMLTETAGCELASPVFIHAHQLQPGWRGRPEYKPTVNFPHPWPGGWWRLADMVNQIRLSSVTALETGARNREMLLRGMAQKAARQVAIGQTKAPFAYVMPPDQHDPLTALKLLETLMFAGVEVHRAEEPLAVGDARYPAGTYVLRLDQPLRPYLKALLGQQFFPDNEWTRQRDGSPMRPYDMTTYALSEFMGVWLAEAGAPLQTDMTRVETLDYPSGSVADDAGNGWLLDPCLNDSFSAVNRILAAGGTVQRIPSAVEADGEIWPPGAFHVRADAAVLQPIARELHLAFVAAPAETPADAYPLKPLRLGIYQRYQGGNMDEGWTRWVLEQFEFPYEILKSFDIKAGGLRPKFDVILLADDELDSLLGPDYEKLGPGDRPVPPGYRSGLGDEGVRAMEEFVRAGGTLLTFNQASELPLKKFRLPLRNVLEGLPSDDFYGPGVTLWMRFDITHPVAFGMPAEGLGLFWNSPAFAVEPNHRNEDYRVVAGYDDRDPLQSGWLIGPQHLFGKASVIDARLGRGHVVLFGLRPQLRAQTHGTFKLLFNALYLGGVPDGE